MWRLCLLKKNANNTIDQSVAYTNANIPNRYYRYAMTTCFVMLFAFLSFFLFPSQNFPLISDLLSILNFHMEIFFYDRKLIAFNNIIVLLFRCHDNDDSFRGNCCHNRTTFYHSTAGKLMRTLLERLTRNTNVKRQLKLMNWGHIIHKFHLPVNQTPAQRNRKVKQNKKKKCHQNREFNYEQYFFIFKFRNQPLHGSEMKRYLHVEKKIDYLIFDFITKWRTTSISAFGNDWLTVSVGQSRQIYRICRANLTEEDIETQT